MPALVSCEVSHYILNTRSGVVHPCDCSTVNDLHLPNSSAYLLGFATFPEAEKKAKELGLDGHVPLKCVLKVPDTVPVREPSTAAHSIPELTEQGVLEILKLSEGKQTRSGNPAHPGLHVPLNNESPAEMVTKIKQAYASGDRELRAPVTTMFQSAADAARSFVTLLSRKANQAVVGGISRFHDRNAISPSNAASDPAISKVKATLYSSQTGRDRTVEAAQAVAVLECDKPSGCSTVSDLTVVTFYPKAK